MRFRATSDVLCPLIEVQVPEQQGGARIDIAQGCSGGCCALAERGVVRAREVVDLDEDLRMAVPHGRRYVLVGDVDPLTGPVPQVLRGLRKVAAAYPEAPLACLSSPQLHRLRTVEDLASFARAGLRRIVLHLGTGCVPLYPSQGKPGSFADVFLSAARIKQAHRSLTIGIVVSLALRGECAALGDHVGDTCGLLERLGLARGDSVYLVPGKGMRADRMRARAAAFHGRLERTLGPRQVEVAELWGC